MPIKENYMKQLNEEEVKIYQLGILNTVADFCEKNQIQYWLDCGTLLGAIRHKGIFLGMMILILECCGQILTDL